MFYVNQVKSMSCPDQDENYRQDHRSLTEQTC